MQEDSFHSLRSDYPDIAAEWDAVKNAPLTPDEIGHGSTKKVWWICEKGHSYFARIDHRTIMHSGCPYCHGRKPIKGENDLATVYPEIAAEWDHGKNNSAPSDYLPKSNATVYWLCPICGTSYKKKISARVLSHLSCPNCAKEKGTSFQEQSLAFYLKQVTTVLNRYRKFGKEIDIFLPEFNIGIEYNGRHYHHNKQKSDQAKIQWLKEKGIRVLSVNEASENSVQTDIITLESTDTGKVHTKNLEWAIRKVFEVLEIPCPRIAIDNDHIKIQEQYIISSKDDNLTSRYPEITKQWDYELNGTLKPESFLYASNHSVYWKCDICHNSYKAPISNRTVSAQGCPYCAGKKVKAGFNDLASNRPDLAAQWSSKNVKGPDEYIVNSHKKAWWHCPQCGSEWESVIASRTFQNTGCPVCAGRKVLVGYNDLNTLYPLIAKEWHQTRNGTLTASDVVAGSNKSVWWQCSNCGHEWKTTVVSRVSGTGCPDCAIKKRTVSRQNNIIQTRGSLLDNDPALAAEWDRERNGALTPSDVTCGSDKIVWWKCHKCGSNWQAAISSRHCSGNGCPECRMKKSHISMHESRLKKRGSISTNNPKLASEWNYEKNGELTPYDLTCGSKKKVWWKCEKGHEWQAVVYSRKKCGCPVCAGKKQIQF